MEKYSDEVIETFLNGHNDLKNVVKIEANYYSSSASVYTRKNKHSPKVLKKYPFKPFVFVKRLRDANLFQSYPIAIPIEDFSEEKNAFVLDNKVEYLGDVYTFHSYMNEGNTVIITKRVDDDDEKKKLLIKKFKEYNISLKELRTDGVYRLDNGYKHRLLISPPSEKKYYTNPLLAYGRNGKRQEIIGSYKDLLNFLLDIGLDYRIRSGVFLDENKFGDFIKLNDLKKKLLLLFTTSDYPIPSDENDYEVESVDMEEENDIEKEVNNKVAKSHLYESIFFNISAKGVDNLNTFINEIGIDTEKIFEDILKEVSSSPKKINDEAINILINHKNNILNLPKILFDAKDDYNKTDEVDKLVVTGLTSITSITKKHLKNVNKISIQKTFDYFKSKDEETLLKLIDEIILKQTVSNTDISFHILNINKILKSEFYKFDGKKTFKSIRNILETNDIDIFYGIDSYVYKVQPVEQFMIQTGIRYFKGIEQFDDLVISCFDIETTALDSCKHLPKAALSAKTGRIFAIGICDNLGNKKNYYAQNEKEEKELIEKIFFKIGETNADILLGHNIEDFDFTMMVERYAYLCGEYKESSKIGKGGIYYRDTTFDIEATEKRINNIVRAGLLENYHEDEIPLNVFSRNKQGMLKVGGSTQNVKQTSILGSNVSDTIFSTRRQRAIDKRITSDALKWNVNYNNLQNPNRVIIKGEYNGIGNTMESKNDFYWNPVNGKYFENNKVIKFEKFDNDSRHIFKIINTEYYKNKDVLYCIDGSFDEHIQSCKNVFVLDFLKSDSDFDLLRKKRDDYDTIIFPSEGLFLNERDIDKEKWTNLFRSPIIAFKNEYKDMETLYHVDLKEYEKTTGKFLLDQYLLGDLDDPIKLNEIYAQPSLQLAYWLPTTFARTSTMGGAGMWRLLLTCWNYEQDIAIPIHDEPRLYHGALVGMFETGFNAKCIKVDFSSFYPSYFLTHCTSPDIDITHIYKALLNYTLKTRLKYKKDRLYYKEIGDKFMEIKLEKSEIPLKIFNNTFYGALAFVGNEFNSFDGAEWITLGCRQYLRHCMLYFEEQKFKSLNCHTDGILLTCGDSNEKYKYIGKGNNWLVIKDKEYIGYSAYVAEYNDLYMKGIMGLDIDDVYESVAIFAKGNYITCKLAKDKKTGKFNHKVDMTGGGIINKSSSEIIKDFLLVENNLVELMKGDSINFVKNCLKKQEEIIEYKITKEKLASSVQVTLSPEAYQEHLKKKNKAGNALPRRVANEIALKYNLNFEVGERIKYLNVGESSKDVDINQQGHLNCVLLQDDDAKYNVEKYLFKFTKSLTPFSMLFDEKVRDKLFYTKNDFIKYQKVKKVPKTKKNKKLEEDLFGGEFICENIQNVVSLSDREIVNGVYFKKSITGNDDFSLISNQPTAKVIQDDFDEILELPASELFFWNKIGQDVNSFLIEKE